MSKEFKTVTIKNLGFHHSGIHNGYLVKSTCLPNCARRIKDCLEAVQLAEYWESVALSK